MLKIECCLIVRAMKSGQLCSDLLPFALAKKFSMTENSPLCPALLVFVLSLSRFCTFTYFLYLCISKVLSSIYSSEIRLQMDFQLSNALHQGKKAKRNANNIVIRK